MTNKLMRKLIIPECISIPKMAFRPGVTYQLRFHGTRSLRMMRTSISIGTMAVAYISLIAKQALDAAHEADKNSRLSLTREFSSRFLRRLRETADHLQTYTIVRYNKVPFQLVEYTFANVGTPAGGKPFIIT